MKSKDLLNKKVLKEIVNHSGKQIGDSAIIALNSIISEKIVYMCNQLPSSITRIQIQDIHAINAFKIDPPKKKRIRLVNRGLL